MPEDSRFDSALSGEAQSSIQELGGVDVVLGIPTFNNAETVAHVIEEITRGFDDKFPERKAFLMVSDGDSDDDTRENAKKATTPEDMSRLVTRYKGIPGKGSAFRSIFEACGILDAEAALLVDGDLRKFPPSWVESHLEPILNQNMDLMAPLYIRHKYDATITNNVCYPTVRSVFGKDIRQPIGGDFTVSSELMKFYRNQDVWDTDVARFGIDIWMTTTAICEGFDVGQTNLGAKIHDPKDPGESLGPMFRQVVGTLFRQMKRYKTYWESISDIETIPKFGPPVQDEPKPVSVNRKKLEEKVVSGWETYAELYERILSEDTFDSVSEIMNSFHENGSLGLMHPETWARAVFDFGATYNFSEELDSQEIMDAMVPLYFARCFALFHEMDPMLGDEAERYLRELPVEFAEERPYLINCWDSKD